MLFSIYMIPVPVPDLNLIKGLEPATPIFELSKIFYLEVYYEYFSIHECLLFDALCYEYRSHADPTS
jgi:hypothetical protein